MNKVKLHLITILTLAGMLVLCLALALGALMPLNRAFAADKTYSPTSIFWERTTSDGRIGEIKGYKLSDDEDADAYIAFLHNDGGSVEYHRNLALKWYTAATTATQSDLVNPGQAQYFSLELVFPEINFTTYTITFQSAEENISKDGQAVNKIVFSYEEGKLYAYIVDASQQQDEELDSHPDYAQEISNPTGDIKLTFGEEGCAGGEFAVTLNGNPDFGKVTNIGGNYLEYKSSGNANTPMVFTANLSDAAAEANAKQKVIVKSLNGQTFELTGGEEAEEAEDDGTVAYTGGKVTDNAPAVLVLNEKVYAFTLGQRFSLTYEVMDICATSLSTPSRYYYMVQKDGEDWVHPVKDTDEEEDDKTKDEDEDETPDDAETDGNDDTETGDGEEPKEPTNVYKKLTTNDYLMPPNDTGDETQYVSIRIVIDDGRTGANKEYIYLTWYAAENAVATLNDANGESYDYILVDLERTGPMFTDVTVAKEDEVVSDEDKVNTVAEDGARVAYQEAVKAAADGLSSGNGAYFYLPSLRGLIESNCADYRNLRFSIYYKKPIAGTSGSSETSLRYNNLRFQVDKKGKYIFRVIASDAAGNAMQMWHEGKLVSVTADNVWDIEAIPEFEFTVSYTGATIEKSGEQTIGYRGSSYNITDFEIIAGDNCEKVYTLYFFDVTKLLDGQTEPTYTQFVEKADDPVAMEDFWTDYADCFREIREYNDEVLSTDSDWDDTDNDYYWDPDSSLSFTPQESGFYVVKLVHTDPNLARKETYAYQVIEVRNPIDYIRGQSNWLQNNVTSVVLFSISGVLAIIIVILFVVKPAEQTVEEVDLSKLKGKKKK